MKLRAFIGKVCHLVANMRAHQRQEHEGRLMVSWKVAGEVITVSASCRDLSESGVGIATSEPFEYGQTLRLRSAALSGVRTAAVRYCRRHGAVYHVGLEFTNVPDFTPIWQLKEMEMLMEGLNW